MDEKEITCIVCPLGCKILVKTDGKRFELLHGNKCQKGVEYVRNEALDPRRVLTSSILVKNGAYSLVSVKTNKPIPKDEIFNILKIIKNKSVNAPIYIGDIIIKNILDTGSDIIATKTVKKL